MLTVSRCQPIKWKMTWNLRRLAQELWTQVVRLSLNQMKGWGPSKAPPTPVTYRSFISESDWGSTTDRQESGLGMLFVGCLTPQQHVSVSQGRICLASQQHASVSQGRICLTSQQHASVSQGRICLTSQQHAGVSQGRIWLGDCKLDYRVQCQVLVT